MTITPIRKRLGPLASGGLTIGFLAAPLTSCSPSASGQAEKAALQLAQARAHAARLDYHREQKAREIAPLEVEEPKVPQNEIRYYAVPVEAHTDEDGLLIEAHKLTLAIVQP